MRHKFAGLVKIGLLGLACVSSVPAQQGGHTFRYELS